MNKGTAAWIYVGLAPVTITGHNRAVVKTLRAYLNTHDVSKFPNLKYIQNERGIDILDRLERYLGMVDSMLFDTGQTNKH